MDDADLRARLDGVSATVAQEASQTRVAIAQLTGNLETLQATITGQLAIGSQERAHLREHLGAQLVTVDTSARERDQDLTVRVAAAERDLDDLRMTRARLIGFGFGLAAVSSGVGAIVGQLTGVL